MRNYISLLSIAIGKKAKTEASIKDIDISNIINREAYLNRKELISKAKHNQFLSDVDFWLLN